MLGHHLGQHLGWHTGGVFPVSIYPVPKKAQLTHTRTAVLVLSAPIAIIVHTANTVIRMEVSVEEPFRQGQLHRPLQVQVFTATGFVNFPAEFPGGVTFRMVSGSTVVTGPATGDASGNLTYAWQAGNLDVPGTYAAYFIGTDGAGKTETFPDGTNLEIVVVPTI